MKISFEYHKSDLFEIAQKRNAGEKNAEKPQMLKNESPIRVDISKEAMDKYRKEIQDKTPVEDEEKIHWLNTEDYTINCVRISNLPVKEQTEDLLKVYEAKYRQIEKGYDDGTIKIYSEDEENRILTKEEALQKLTESYQDHVKSVKERAEQQRKSEKMLAGSLRKADSR